MLMSRARADLQKIMALKRAILESAVLLGYSSMQNRSCDCFCVQFRGLRRFFLVGGADVYGKNFDGHAHFA